MWKLTPVGAMALTVVLSACSSEKNDEANNVSGSSGYLDTPIVSVSSEELPGFTVSEQEMDLMLERMGGSAAMAVGGQEFTDKIQKSLIVSKAMALSASQGMTAEELSLIELRTRQFKEELLVKEWLKSRVVPNPPSVDEVNQFYQNNLAQFGYKKLRSVELLTISPPKGNHAQVKAMQLLSETKELSQLSNTIQMLRDQGIALTVKTFELNVSDSGSSNDALKSLPTQLIAKAEGMDVKDMSSVIVINGQWNVLTVLEEKEIPAKPLVEVSGSIRKQLAPMKFRESVKELTDELYQTLTITPVDL